MQNTCPRCTTQMTQSADIHALTTWRRKGEQEAFNPHVGLQVWVHGCPECGLIELYGLSDEEKRTGKPE